MILTDYLSRRRPRPDQGPNWHGQPCTLDCLSPGCRACLHRLACCPHIARRLAHMGIVPGVELTVLQNGGGPLLVAVGDTRVALGRDVVCHLHVTHARSRDAEAPTS